METSLVAASAGAQVGPRGLSKRRITAAGLRVRAERSQHSQTPIIFEGVCRFTRSLAAGSTTEWPSEWCRLTRGHPHPLTPGPGFRPVPVSEAPRATGLARHHRIRSCVRPWCSFTGSVHPVVWLAADMYTMSDRLSLGGGPEEVASGSVPAAVLGRSAPRSRPGRGSGGSSR